jgi:hypothetical protein
MLNRSFCKPTASRVNQRTRTAYLQPVRVPVLPITVKTSGLNWVPVTVLWIRIRKDPKVFTGSGSVT